MIRQRKDFLKKCDTEIDNNLKPDPLRGKTALDVFFKLYDEGVVTEIQMVDEINGLLFAGHDATSHALLYTIVLLGSHQDVQDRLYAEIQNVFGDSNLDVSTSDLPRLVYMEAVLKESLRLYSVVPVVARHVDKNVKLKKYTLLAGATAFVVLYGMNRHPSWGVDAECFRPERWLDPTSLPGNAQLSTFSLGKRACFGKVAAMMVLKVFLVHLIRHYRFIADRTKMQLTFQLLITPKDGHQVYLERRQ